MTGWRFLANSSRSLWQVKQTNKQKRITVRNWLVLKSNEFTLGLITVKFSTKKKELTTVSFQIWDGLFVGDFFCFVLDQHTKQESLNWHPLQDQAATTPEL